MQLSAGWKVGLKIFFSKTIAASSLSYLTHRLTNLDSPVTLKKGTILTDENVFLPFI